MNRKFSLELLRQFNQLRSAIEPEAAALAALLADDGELAAIEAGLERMRAAQNGGDQILEADIEFHVAVLKGL